MENEASRIAGSDSGLGLDMGDFNIWEIGLLKRNRECHLEVDVGRGLGDGYVGCNRHSCYVCSAEVHVECDCAGTAGGRCPGSRSDGRE